MYSTFKQVLLFTVNLEDFSNAPGCYLRHYSHHRRDILELVHVVYFFFGAVVDGCIGCVLDLVLGQDVLLHSCYLNFESTLFDCAWWKEHFELLCVFIGSLCSRRITILLCLRVGGLVSI